MPDTVLVEIAAALAAKASDSLYDLVRNAFKGRKKAIQALDAADGAAPDSPLLVALARELELAETSDQRFAEQLRAEWSGVVNRITGTVTGNVVQARDIHGDITFGSA